MALKNENMVLLFRFRVNRKEAKVPVGEQLNEISHPIQQRISPNPRQLVCGDSSVENRELTSTVGSGNGPFAPFLPHHAMS